MNSRFYQVDKNNTKLETTTQSLSTSILYTVYDYYSALNRMLGSLGGHPAGIRLPSHKCSDNFASIVHIEFTKTLVK